MSTDRTTEILNYLSAMSRDIGEFRQETKARLNSLESRLEALDARAGSHDARFDRLESEVKEGFVSVRKEIQLLARKMDTLILEGADTRARVGVLEDRVEKLERKQT